MPLAWVRHGSESAPADNLEALSQFRETSCNGQAEVLCNSVQNNVDVLRTMYGIFGEFVDRDLGTLCTSEPRCPCRQHQDRRVQGLP